MNLLKTIIVIKNEGISLFFNNKELLLLIKFHSKFFFYLGHFLFVCFSFGKLKQSLGGKKQEFCNSSPTKINV